MAAKGRDIRVKVTLECTECRGSQQPGVARYSTTKNRRNTTGRLELKKYCRYCRRHTVHVEKRK